MIEKEKELLNIIEKFDIEGDASSITAINNGIINTTYVATFKKDAKTSKYILQKINTNIFKNPYRLMKNIENVTNYIKNKDSSSKDFVSVITTKEGDNLYVTEDDFSHKEYYRVYNYIDDTITYNKSESKEVVYNTGKAFGHFQKVLRDYPMEFLEETIENFHNTKKRYMDFIKR